MQLNSVSNTGFQGVQSGHKSLVDQANSIAKQSFHEAGTVALVDATAGALRAELQVAASAKIVETSSRSRQSLLDIRV